MSLQSASNTSHTAYISGSRDLQDLTNGGGEGGGEVRAYGLRGEAAAGKKKWQDERRRRNGAKGWRSFRGGLVIPVGEADGQRKRGGSPRAPVRYIFYFRGVRALHSSRGRRKEVRKSFRRRDVVFVTIARATGSEYFSSTSDGGAWIRSRQERRERDRREVVFIFGSLVKAPLPENSTSRDLRLKAPSTIDSPCSVPVTNH